MSPEPTKNCLLEKIPGWGKYRVRRKTPYYEIRNYRWARRRQGIFGRPFKMQDACQCAQACTKNQRSMVWIYKHYKILQGICDSKFSTIIRCQAFIFQLDSKNCFLKGALQRRHFRPRDFRPRLVFGKKLKWAKNCKYKYVFCIWL